MIYLIAEDEIKNQDINGCTALDYADDDTIILINVTPAGRVLLAQGAHPERVIEMGEAAKG